MVPVRSRRSRAVLLAAVAVAVAVAVPSVAAGHDIDTPQGHAAADATPRDAALERRLAARTEARAERRVRAMAAQAGLAQDVGRWGPVTPWPVVAVQTAVLPNGKVLAYDSVGDNDAGAYSVHNFTRATVWDPATGSHTPVALSSLNVFCSGLAHLADGTLFLTGGNKDRSLAGIQQTHLFHHATNSWSRGPTMAVGRWYPTLTPLNNGEMLITGGRADVPEVRTTAGTLRRLTTAPLSLPLFPWMDLAPDGRVFLSGPGDELRKISTGGTGGWQYLGSRGDGMYRGYGGHAVYDIGKILVAGGGRSSRDTRIIDMSPATPTKTMVAPMAFGRRQHNLTVLADGSVLATGGNSNGAELVDVRASVYPAELWNPTTRTWKTMAPMAVTRQYHSTALLLPDARVLSAGGGVCGTCTAQGYLGKNAEIFTPPYLFRRDGSGALAARPSITSSAARVGYGAAFTITTPQATAIRKVALVRLGAVSHSVNMEQRYVPLSFTPGTGALTARGPANANLAPPGFYMLFLVDGNGVPSVGSIVRLGG